MLEVTPAVVVAHLDLFGKHARFPSDLFEGLPWDERTLRGHRGRVDWDPYAELLDRLGALVGDDDRVEAVGAQMDETAAWLNLLLASVVSPLQLYHFWERMIPHGWRCLTVAITPLDAERIDLRVELDPARRGCRTMFVASRGSMRTMPCRLGLAEAALESAEVSAFHGVYRLHLPPSRTLPARAGGRLGGLFTALSSDRGEVEHALSRIQASSARLQDHLRAVERVGEVGRAVAAASSLDEVARLAGAVLIDDCGYSAVRLWVTPPGEDEPVPILARDVPSRRADTTHEVSQEGGAVGRLETWGTPRSADLVAALVPWIAAGLGLQRELHARRELATRAVRDREALAVLLEERATFLLGSEGAVEWCNPRGRAELDQDPGLAQRLSGPLDPAAYEVHEGRSHRVVRQRPDAAEVDRRAARAAERWGLTATQERVLACVARGLSTDDVARALEVRVATVNTHLTQVFRRSGTGSRGELLFSFWTLSEPG